MGIRLNTKKPDVYFKLKKTGGVKLTSMVPLTNISEKLAQLILHEYKIHNCELVIREDITTDQLIDVICANRMYLPCIYVYNKVDQITIEEVSRILLLVVYRSNLIFEFTCHQEFNKKQGLC